MKPNTDLPTIVSVAAVACVVATVIHEGIGHGGACVAVGCHPQLLTSMQFQGDERGISVIASKLISAAGIVANLMAALVAILLLRRQNATARSGWFFLWLFAANNLFHATGYLLYSGISDIGDWAAVIRGLRPVWLWRTVLVAIGAWTYWLAARWAMRRLGERLSQDGDRRVSEANRYSLVSYVVGGALSLIAGLFDPGGGMLIVISGAAASLGGTSALAWGPQLLHDPTFGRFTKQPLVLTRDWRWIAGAVLSSLFFVFVLGPGIHAGR
jgi:hypothetical protein